MRKIENQGMKGGWKRRRKMERGYEEGMNIEKYGSALLYGT